MARPGAGAGDFFGRIDTDAPPSGTYYIGRRHIETTDHEPVVVDWRAPVAAPFYRATVVDGVIVQQGDLALPELAPRSAVLAGIAAGEPVPRR